MKRREMLALVRTFASAVRIAADRTGLHHDIATLEDIIRRQEKKHRALGRRLCGARSRLTMQQAVDYFVARTIADAMSRPDRPIADLAGVRDDYVRAAIICTAPDFRRTLRARLLDCFPARDTSDSVLASVLLCDYAALQSTDVARARGVAS